MKITELINIEVVITKKPYEKYTTKWGIKPFKIGRIVNRDLPATDPDNFESAEPKKGVSPKDLVWEAEKPDFNTWTTKYSCVCDIKGKVEYIDLTWLQHKNLMQVVDKFPCRVIPKLDDKTVRFEVARELATKKDLSFNEDVPF